MTRPLPLLLVLLAPLVAFAAMVGADRTFGAPGRAIDYVIRLPLPREREVDLPPVAGPPDASRPLVVLDPGHGGQDPGAGTADLREKALTLSLAKAIRDELVRGGGIRVALTRNEDKYLLLEERSGIARRLGADVFLSIHADSDADASGDAEGATVYTLSERGSTEEAARLAARENRADTVNGVSLGQTSDAVSAILVDLSLRESQAKAEQLSSLILRERAPGMAFRTPPKQSAAFVVLKAPDVPSVLYEVGYISNPEEAGRLLSKEGREAFARATARAIRVYLARQSLG
jgi:N-acetylmuramoyl-L-alanine amidase